MAKIAWGRGFFRVWMLVAVLWWIGGAVIGYWLVVVPSVSTKNLNRTLSGSYQLYSPYGPETRAFEEAVTARTAVASEVRPGYRLYTPATTSDADLTKYRGEGAEVVDDYINTMTVSQRSAVLPTWVGWTVAPPLVLLILGWAIAWVLSGFRQTPENIR